jgi:wyosine [tRNA(Phe)-imidazoG37] synthetase (radical SAM superfamily)
MTYRYIYGPVPSRRLGRSLGISTIPDKTCNKSCIYCMLGRTDHPTVVRQEFFPLQDIVGELKDALKHITPPPDYISIVGNGEPTLYLRLGDLIREIRHLTSIPVAVITNGVLLSDPAVRADLAEADIVLTSFNAPTDALFHRIDRPCAGITFDAVRQGLIAYSRMQRQGQLWVEMMLLEGINDSPAVLQELHWLLQEVGPDRVFVDTPIRPPAEPFVRPVGSEKLAEAESILGGVQLSGSDFEAFTVDAGVDPVDTLVSICKRHPMREDQVIALLRRSGIDPYPVLNKLCADPRFRVERYGGSTFYLAHDENRRVE